jgi:hypothetical protein
VWEKLRKDRPLSSRRQRRQVVLEGLQEVSQVTRRWTSFAEEHLVIRGFQRKNGRSKFSEEISRIP